MIFFTQGDSVMMHLTATDGLGAPQDLTGAVFTSYLNASNGLILTFDNSKHVADPDQTNKKGQFTLRLLAADTAPINPGNNKELVCNIVIGLTNVTYRNTKGVTVLSRLPGN